MKTKNKNITDNTLLDQLREIRDKISLDIKDMTGEQLKEYLANKKSLHTKAVWLK